MPPALTASGASLCNMTDCITITDILRSKRDTSPGANVCSPDHVVAFVERNKRCLPDRETHHSDVFEQIRLLVTSALAANSVARDVKEHFQEEFVSGSHGRHIRAADSDITRYQDGSCFPFSTRLKQQNPQAVDMDVQMEFNERLINEVQQQTCLYDCNDIAYKNSIRRNDVWDEIAITLTCSVETAKTRWKTLRDRYKKEMKKCRVGIPITWSHYNQMKFLDPYLKDRASSPLPTHASLDDRQDTNGTHDRNGSWNDDIDSFDGESEAVSVLLARSVSNSAPSAASSLTTASPSAPISTPTAITAGDPRPAQPASRGRKRKSHADPLDAVPISQVQAHSSLPSRAEIISTNDEDEIFGHIVAMKLQKMPERMKSIAKMRVLETLIEVQYGKQALQNGTADID